MKDIESKISYFVENQFPSFYKEEGETFISFVKAYYEWLETPGNTLGEARKLLNYRDIDETLDKFIIYFKEKYLKNVQFTTASNRQQFIKNSQDLYRSKGSERAIDLFFKLLYGVDVDVYVPGTDLFKLSDGDYVQPTYLEITRETRNIDFVGKQIIGVNSEATAFVEKLIRRRIKTKYIDVFYLSKLSGDFQTGEQINISGQRIDGAPFVIGSGSTLEILTSGRGYSTNTVVTFSSDNGAQGKAKVSGVEQITGIVNFELIDGGFGYSTNTNISTVLVSDKVLSLNTAVVSNTSLSRPYTVFETVSQHVANVTFKNIVTLTVNAASGPFTNGEVLFQELDGSNTVLATVVNTDISSNTGTITVKEANTGSFTTSIAVEGASSGNTATLVSFAVSNTPTVGNTITNYYSNGDIAGNGTIAAVFTNSTPYIGTVRVAVQNGDLNDTGDANYTTTAYFSNTTSANSSEVTINAFATVNATGNVVGQSSDITLHCTSYTPTFAVGEVLEQNTGSSFANGTVANVTTVGANVSVGVSNVSGVFFQGTRVIGDTTNASANVDTFALNLGLHNIQNDFTNIALHSVTGQTSNTTANVFIISTGSGADFQIGSTDNEEQLFISTDFIGGNNNSGTPYTTIALNANSYGFPGAPTGNVSFKTILEQLEFFTGNVGIITTLQNINPGDGLYSIAPIVAVHSPQIQGLDRKDLVLDVTSLNDIVPLEGEIIQGTVTVGNTLILTTENMGDVPTFNDRIIQKYPTNATSINSDSAVSNSADTISIASNPFSNGDIVVYEVAAGNTAISGLQDDRVYNVQYANSTVLALSEFGGTTNVDLTSAGTGETGHSLTLVAGGFVAGFAFDANSGSITIERPFGETFVVSNATHSNYIDTGGDTGNVTAVSTTTTGTAKGVVRSGNTSQVIVKPITLAKQFTTGATITGASSGAQSSIDSITTNTASLPAGLNAQVPATVISANGAATSLTVFDSGFGYLDNETVTFTDGNFAGTAKIKLGKQGVGEGYFSSTKGFLSNDKKLFDGDFYQEYSYEILSKLPFEKYSEVFRKVMHMAGSQFFGRVVLDSIGNSEMTSTNTANDFVDLTISGFANTETLANGEFVYQSNGTANTGTGIVYEPLMSTMTLTTSANVKYQINERIAQPNASVNTASGILLGKSSNATANTLTLHIGNVSGTFTASANIEGTTNTTITTDPIVKISITSVSSANDSTGSFQVGERVTQTGGFDGNVVFATSYIIHCMDITGTYANSTTLTGGTSGTTAVGTGSTNTALANAVTAFQTKTIIDYTSNTSAFSNGATIYQRQINKSVANQVFVNSAIGEISSVNSTALEIINVEGYFFKDEDIYSLTVNATATGVRTVNTATGTVISQSNTEVTLIDVSGTFTENNQIQTANACANITSIATNTYITQSSNVDSVINNIKIANVSGYFVTDYELAGNTNSANVTITAVNVERE